MTSNQPKIQQPHRAHASQVIVEERQHRRIPALILSLDLRISQIGPRRHPPMHLRIKRLDMLRGRQRTLIRLDVVGQLVLAGQHAHGDLAALGVVRGHHGRVDLRAGLDLGVALRDEGDDLGAPAVAHGAPGFDVRVCLFGFGEHGLDAVEGVGGRGLGLEELAELGALLVCLGRVPGDVGGFAVEEVGHEDLVFVRLVRVGEDVGALDRLREEAEDVVDEDEGFGGVGWAGDVWSWLSVFLGEYS